MKTPSFKLEQTAFLIINVLNERKAPLRFIANLDHKVFAIAVERAAPCLSEHSLRIRFEPHIRRRPVCHRTRSLGQILVARTV
jgi:hypothetical protein